MRKFNNRYDHSTWLIDKIIVLGAKFPLLQPFTCVQS